MSHSLSDAKLNTLSIIERVCSSLSLVGCLITIVSFLCSAKFRKPINRLVFYATFGNLIANVATLMAGAFSASPRAGPCQFQGFLIQMFIPADAYWTLVMAINVHLTFYNHFDAHRLRAIEWPYVFVCYGIPFIPALVFLFVRGHGGDKPYGNATLWCWLTPEWNVYRVAFFYAPVWLTIVLTIIIYVRAGRMIFRIRNQLKNFQSSNHDTVESMIPPTVKTTEVTVQSEPNEQSLQPPPSCPINPNTSFSGPSSGYTVSIGVGQPQTLAELLTESSETLENPENPAPGPELNTIEPIGETVQVEPIISTSQPNQPTRHHHHNFHPHLPHHLPHFHLHSHIHIRHHRHLSSIEKQRRHALNKAAWSYTKCAMLFFTAMLITWIPASVNRLYSYTHGNESSLVLEVMSALVLPMQGFWNFTIYAAFSSDAFKDKFRKWSAWSISTHQILSSISWSSNTILWWNRKVNDVSTAGAESTRRPSEPINNV